VRIPQGGGCKRQNWGGSDDSCIQEPGQGEVPCDSPVTPGTGFNEERQQLFLGNLREGRGPGEQRWQGGGGWIESWENAAGFKNNDDFKKAKFGIKGGSGER